MGDNTIQKQIREYVVEAFLLGQDESALTNGESFLESGLIDSTGVLELIQFVEDSFEIEIEDEEMIPENLDSIDLLVRFVESKIGAAGDV
jgi:acyl carrier protein